MKTSSVEQFKSWIDHIGEQFSAYPWEDQNAYAHWLAQTYFYVRHTTTMICMVAADYGAKNPSGFDMALHHLKEERGHDLMLIKDLEHLERNIEEFKEEPETQLFYQNQYYMIQNRGPESHLGYALLLEGMCSKFGPDVLRRVQKAHGREAAVFLEVHVVADQDHAAEGFEQLAALGPEVAKGVLRNVEQSAFLYERVLMKAAEAGGQKLNLKKVA
jgi:hypothetical protein